MKSYSEVAPRIAIAPNGEMVTFDQNGEVLQPPQTKKENLKADLDGAENVHQQSLTMYSLTNAGECKVYVDLGFAVFCFVIDCQTGAFLGFCR